MRLIKNITKIILTTALTFSLSSCENILIQPVDEGIVIKLKKSQPPRIKDLSYYPRKVTNPDDIVTFNVKAIADDNDSLQFSWKSNKGTLLSNSGSTINWQPKDSNGELETGTASITVTVSDGRFSTDSTANVYVSSNGKVEINEFPEEEEYEVNYDIPNIGTLFSESFEKDNFEDNWSISEDKSKYRSNNSYLTWKRKIVNGNNVAILTGPSGEILPNSNHSEVKITSNAINLRNVKRPRLKLKVKSLANPSSSVKLRIYWESQGYITKPLNVSFIPDKGWKNLDIDLNNILNKGSSKVGFLTIGIEVVGNKSSFSGPMIDDIIVYDN